MSILQLFSAQQRRNFQVLFLAGLLFWAAMSSLLPTLPLYIGQAGGSSQNIGWVMGSFAIGLLLSRPWLGRLADRRSRKWVLVIGMAVATLAPVGYWLTESIPLLVGIRAFHGISIAAFATGYITLVVDMAPPQHRGEIIGYMSLVNPIGAALGPALGGFLQSSLGFTPLFWTAASLGLLGLICTCQVQEPPLHVDLSKEGSTNHAQFWRLLASPRISSLTVVMLLVGLSFGAMSIFIPLFIAEAEASLNPGLFFTVGAISSLIIRFVTGRASDRYGRGLFITLSLTAYTVAMSMLWFANTVTGFLLAGLFEGAGFGILIPMVSALIADRSEPQERGRLFGLCMAGFDLGIGLSGPLFGSVADAVGYRLMFCLAGVLAFVSLAVFVTLSNQNMRQSVQFALGQGRDFYAVQDIRLKTQS